MRSIGRIEEGGFVLGDTTRKKVAIFSHERSGTHFLMNTIALNFGFVARPWWNFDYELGLNFNSQNALEAYFKNFREKPVLNIMKSHHQASFLTNLLDMLSEEFHIFYIIRDPHDVMVSYWKLLHTLRWDEGPVTETVSEFLRTSPRGGMLRYQKEQVPTILHRWQVHVEGWFELKSSYPITFIRYEALYSTFNRIVRRLGNQLALKPPSLLRRPHPNQNVIGLGQGGTGQHQSYFTEDDYEFVATEIGSTLEQLGYPIYPTDSPVGDVSKIA